MADKDAWRGPFWRLRRSLRRGDEASSSMVTFIVGASAFFVSSAVMLNFVAEPPGGTSGLEHAELKGRAGDLLNLMLGTPGYPLEWAANETTVDELQRLGLAMKGSSLRVDPYKFQALANGSFVAPDPTNGRVDYHEARESLGLQGYEFHLRAHPLMDAFESDTFGIEDMDDFRVAYIGDFSKISGAWVESPGSLSERHHLDGLPLAFENDTRASLLGTGDAFIDDKDNLRNYLVPQLGAAPMQTVISAGSGSPKHDFELVTQSQCETWLIGSCSAALALNEEGADAFGYTKSRELRSVLGLANLSAASTTAAVSWNEVVSTTSDANDYGYVEVSPDNGLTWYKIGSHSTHSLLQTSWNTRAETINALNCSACLGAHEVWVALRWVADSSTVPSTSKGWMVDDVRVTIDSDIVFAKNFEKPDYDLLVIGSNVDQNALTPAEIKNAIRDYVTVYNGRLLVLGGQTNTNWLQPLFHVGVRDGSPGVSTPDATHPLLTIPNELDWESYENNDKIWDFTGQQSDQLFNMVVGDSSGGHVMSVSSRGAFGEGQQDGVVMLTTYLPYDMPGDDAKKFFANVFTYGRYHRLYMEVGPAVPDNVPVATSTRTSTMDKTAIGSDDFIEMSFIIYLWKGTTNAESVPIQATPRPPQDLTLVAGDAQIHLDWEVPSSEGAAEITDYNIYRGHMQGTETFYTNVGSTATEFLDTGLTNGQTYYYYVTAVNKHGDGSISKIASATPAAVPGAPLNPRGVGALLANEFDWSAPSSSGGATITHYNVYRSDDNITFALLANTTSLAYVDTPVTGTYYYRVSAANSIGEGPVSAGVPIAPLQAPTQPLALVAQPLLGDISLTWLPPADNGTATLTGYKIYRGTTSGSLALHEEVGTDLLYLDTSVAPDETYYYQVSALTSDGEGALSDEASATLAAVPSAPQTLDASLVLGKITLTWAAPANPGGSVLTGYQIYRGTTSGNVAHFANVSAANLSFVDQNVNATTMYIYHVRAVNSQGVSAASNTATETSASPPGAPTSLSATGITGAISLTWVAPVDDGGAPVTHYEVWRGTTADALTWLVNKTLPSHTDTSAATGTLYYYEVRAVNLAGTGPGSNVASATRAL